MSYTRGYELHGPLYNYIYEDYTKKLKSHYDIYRNRIGYYFPTNRVIKQGNENEIIEIEKNFANNPDKEKCIIGIDYT